MLSKFVLAIIIIISITHVANSTERTVTINEVSWPPYFFVDDHSKQLGIGKELLNLCLKESGYKATYVRAPIANTYTYMESGKIDITVFSYKASRDKILYAKEPIFTSEYGFLVRADSDINIKKLSDVIPYQLGHLDGLTYTPEYMKIIEKKDKLDEVSTGYSLDSLFLQLLSPVPRFDIMADSKATFHWFADYTGVSKQVKVLDYTLKNKDYFITVSKRSKNIENPQALLANTDSCLKQLKQDGNYNAIYAKYGQVLD